MKKLTTALLLLLSSMVSLQAKPQIERLKTYYEVQGDALFVPLYWLPETRETVRQHIPDHEQWVGFEKDRWQKIEDEVKQQTLQELGQTLDAMSPSQLQATWRRIGEWQRISTQLNLLIVAMHSQEAFLTMGYHDALLRPAYDWVKKRRPAAFDLEVVGAGDTLATGEVAAFMAVLTEHLLDCLEKDRLLCYSRLFATIAETKAESK
ncbi:hypothetical protein SAMN02745166_03843 [Prosthecobacter debontii]|uniref:Uncharacterized protein n=1 Tax=Prosthecobacter debontii TaxID=48467 RepID=A0A1T4YQM7_9BACT|nr:hypothetical protein [Prosthecobacter debontii]SKB03561.1 hypothetical protein SAMN02745166_03843 [Prosthecobacter debontii]